MIDEVRELLEEKISLEREYFELILISDKKNLPTEVLMIRKLIHKIRKRRFCKLNRWNCPDCIYHEYIFEGATFRGIRCHYPQQTERSEE